MRIQDVDSFKNTQSFFIMKNYCTNKCKVGKFGKITKRISLNYKLGNEDLKKDYKLYERMSLEKI